MNKPELGSLRSRFVIAKRGLFLVNVKDGEPLWSMVLDQAFEGVYSWDNTREAIDFYVQLLRLEVPDITLSIVFQRYFVKGWRVISQQGLRIPEEKFYEDALT